MTNSQNNPQATVPMADDWVTVHMTAVGERQASLSAPGGRLDLIKERLAALRPHRDEQTLLNKGIRAGNKAAKIVWLRKAADRATNAAAKENVSPCKIGCNHCCHIPVAIQASEAEQIAKEAGLRLQKPTRLFSANINTAQAEERILQEKWFGKPCPMLDKNGSCRIYKSRPLACRLHIAVDADDLLCKLVPGATIELPYLDTTMHAAARIIALGGEGMADIREWFDGT